MMLTDMFKNMENLLINIDKAVVQTLDKDHDHMILNMDESFNLDFKKIENERTNHRHSLIDLQTSFNKLNGEEEEIQRKIDILER